jgi:hypothetical protein
MTPATTPTLAPSLARRSAASLAVNRNPGQATGRALELDETLFIVPRTAEIMDASLGVTIVTTLSADGAVIFGEVITAFVFDHLVLDAAHGIVDAPKLDLFGAMHAARWYCSTSNRFETVRPTWAQWMDEGKV